MSIGFLDSGIGGLSVLREALTLLPNEDYIYYADTENAPYGLKTKDEVKSLTMDAVQFLVEKGIKALVIACNTATSAAVEDLRNKYSFPIIGMEPAVKPAVEKEHATGKRVLVLATPLTLKESKFQNLVSRVDADHIVDMLPTPRLVEFAEKFIFEGAQVENYLKEVMPWSSISNYSTVVLGCTHFPLFRQTLIKLLPNYIDIIDGNRGTVKYLAENLKTSHLLNPDSYKGSISFYRSGVLVEDGTILDKYMALLKK